MTDHAFCYIRWQYAEAIAAHRIRHLRTRSYTPRTNDKAERFIQIVLREWTYVKPYRTSRARAGALGSFLTTYNTTRPIPLTAANHRSVASQRRNNLSGSDS